MLRSLRVTSRSKALCSYSRPSSISTSRCEPVGCNPRRLPGPPQLRSHTGSVEIFPGTLLRPGDAFSARSGSSVWFSASTAGGEHPVKVDEKNASGDGDTKEEDGGKGRRKDDSNLFLDNIGKIFLAAIGGVVLMLVRSSRGTANRTAARDRIESLSVLDPLEIDDLRVANSDLTADVWREISREARAAFPSGRATYADFVSVTVQVMRRLKGEAFTVQLGHLLDRVAIALLNENGDPPAGKEADKGVPNSTEDSGNPTREDLPLSLLFSILSLTLNSDVNDRVKVLFDVMKHESTEVTEGKVSEEDVVRMVGYLQQTCQLVPDAQIVLSDVKYPVKQYRKGNPRELVMGAKKTMVEDGTKDADGDDGDRYDETQFHRLLRTKSVCAWGECYVKKRGLD